MDGPINRVTSPASHHIPAEIPNEESRCFFIFAHFIGRHEGARVDEGNDENALIKVENPLRGVDK
jgi:hypothetical protein